MKLQIQRPKNLKKDQELVFDELCRRVKSPDADHDYDRLRRSFNGRMLSADIARNLALEFRSWDGKIRHTPSTANPAGAYVHARLLRELANPEGRRNLLITAGGAGAGKTTALRDRTKTAHLIFDNQFRDLTRAREILKLALAHGWEVEVLHVHRPFDDAVRAVAERSQRTGRWNALEELSSAHIEAQRTIVTVWQEFHRRAHIHAIFNASQAPRKSSGRKSSPPGNTIPIPQLDAGGDYHFPNHAKLEEQIPKVLQEAIDKAIICKELAALIGRKYLKGAIKSR